MIRENLRRLGESLVIRVVPGIINLYTLFYLGHVLQPNDYGIFSTVIATVSFISTMVFGIATYSIMPASAKMKVYGLEREYISSVLVVLSGLSVLVAVSAIITESFRSGSVVAISIIATFGLHTALQEILRSQLRLWAYGWSAIGQALTYQALVMFLVSGDAKVQAALVAFSVSYFVGAIISFWFVGPLDLRRPRLSYLGRSLVTGHAYVLSNLAENGLFVGLRYIVMILGSHDQLGVFSFCVDLAQRSVGFLMNAASFVFVPRAFSHAAVGGIREFKRGLLTGAAVAAVLAAVSAAGIVLLFFSGYGGKWFDNSFDPLSFTVLSAAVLINRTKKVVIDPFALRSYSTLKLTYAYAIGASVSGLISAVGLALSLRYSAEVAFLTGYLLAAACSFVLLKSAILDDGRGEMTKAPKGRSEGAS
ncbi:hypothetical protein [Mesorhizobium sp.]|uniref:hypothetical protein n=1 Tax=Mesorhizobium sp. TaxID=1871066 RepID=UPI000FE3D915|nr:hypothetical protein [Mesorhizobium sp.]RWQ14450.1 MAG: hypothetical protein EOR92_26920 [Mesorhizobium sp.]